MLRRLKRIKLLPLAMAILIVAGVLGDNAFADTSDDAVRAAEAQLITNVLRMCIQRELDSLNSGRGVNTGVYNIPIANGSDLANGNLGGILNNTDAISVGEEWEGAIQGKVKNGTIWCKDNNSNLINVAARVLGISTTELLCNGGEPGLLRRLDEDENGGYKPHANQDCSSFGSDDYGWSPNAMSYLQQKYNDYISSLDVSNAKKWEDDDDINLLPDASWYILRLQEFKKSCGDPDDYTEADSYDNLTNKSDYFTTPLKVTGSDGKVHNRYIKRYSGKYDNTKVPDAVGHNFTCDELIQEMNKSYNSYADVLKESTAEACKERYADEYNRVYNLVMNSGPNSTISKADQNLYDAFAEAEKNGWLEPDGSGGWKCIEVSGSDTDVSDIHSVDPTDLTPINNGSQGSSQPSTYDLCMNSGGAMGWLICPAIYAIESVVSQFYDSVIEPMLAIRVSLFETDSPTYDAWSIFRDFANIAFVILLLIVIFSQVTGYGIDNYGIKKMLPKLIITAILVNLSYIICSLAVDVSNILGSGLKSLFVNVAPDIIAQAGGGPSFMTNVVGALINIGIGVLGAVALVSAIATPGVILTVLIALLSALISILFMLVALGVRMVGVILLTAVAPLALVLYALPNTSKVFDKWFSAFKAMLVVYPICGALIGGGQFAASIIINLVNSGGETSSDLLSFFYVIIALLISVLPFFMVPTLLKNSMAALGNIGAKISGVGAKLGGAAGKAIDGKVRDTNMFKNRQANYNDRKERSFRRSADKRADSIIKGYNRRMANGEQLTRRQNEKLTAAQQTKLKNASLGLSEGRNFDAAMAGIRSAEAEEAIKGASSLLNEGQFSYTDAAGRTHSLSSTDVAGMENAFKYMTSQDPSQQNMAQIMALKRALESTKKGMDAIARTVDSGSMNTKDGSSFHQIMRDISTNNQYKSQARTLFQVAGDLASSPSSYAGGMVSSARDRGDAVGSMKASNISDMTDDEREALFRLAGSGNATAINLAAEGLKLDSVRGALSSHELSQLDDASKGIYRVPH